MAGVTERREMLEVYTKLRMAAIDVLEEARDMQHISDYEQCLQDALDEVEKFHAKYPANKRRKKS